MQFKPAFKNPRKKGATVPVKVKKRRAMVGTGTVGLRHQKGVTGSVPALTHSQAQEIREKYDAGKGVENKFAATVDSLAAEYGVSRSVISKVLLGQPPYEIRHRHTGWTI